MNKATSTFPAAAQSGFIPKLARNALAHIPGEGGWPLVGNTFKVLADPMGYTSSRAQKYGLVFRNHSFGGWNVNLLGPDANELVMFDRDKIFSSEQGWMPILQYLFPRGLMLMDFDEHRVHRKALSVAFKPEPMAAYAEALNAGIAPRIKQWSGKVFKFYPAVKQLTLDLAATSFLGLPWGPEADKINKAFVDMVAGSVGVVRVPVPGTLMAKGAKGRRFMVELFGREIPKRRGNPANDIFSQLCNAEHDDGTLLTDTEIIDHMNFLMMAAHDTLTSSISSTVLMLGQNPEWQEKLREEMHGLGDAHNNLAYDQLHHMPLTEYVFKEALRLTPPVPSFPRRALKDFQFKGFTIPSGAWINISPMHTHRMAEFWPEPLKFDPLRFTPENSKGRHKYAWVPFGGGAHMCLGLHFAYMQTKIFFFHLLRNHRIVIDPAYRGEWHIFPIPKPKDGLPVRIERISDKLQ